MSLRNRTLAGIALLALALTAGVAAAATPNPDSAVITGRVFNDCPGATFTESNLYPSSITLHNVGDNCFGWANLDIWRFAVGGTVAEFPNLSAFTFTTTMVLSGSGQMEGGVQITPWWSEADGRINCRTTDGEIACFGGRLPFYSFTGSHGITYVKGTPITLSMTYLPNGLSSVSPATIQYTIVYNGNTYASPQLPYDQGNTSEDPPHGLWGLLNNGHVGGFMQSLWALGGDPTATTDAVFSDITFQNLDSVGTESNSWTNVKALYR
jgi:hypothetical protein